MVVDGTSYLPMGLLLTGATVTSIGAACFACSLYKGFQEGKRGRSLALHPFTSFGRLLTNRYRQCVSGFSPVSTTSKEDNMNLMDNMMTTSL
ncbi:MAG: hypothetical protein QS721_13640 [Candidatus Endonucleobacter sp. (ex Gigantidas childressi)]|nr:hypothetical protein [Candidatus Endonucleobacter sp. (ex Gigantidas childressi)]